MGTNSNNRDKNDILPLPEDYDYGDYLKISNIIHQLRMLNDNPGYIYNHGVSINYIFSFNDGCTPDDICKLEENIGYLLPKDYKEFLLYTNGMNFSNHVGSYLVGIGEIYINQNIFDYPQSTIVIGSVCDGSAHVVIDLKKEHDACIFIHDVYSGNLQNLNCGFALFFNRFIMTYGSAFWEWAGIGLSF